MCRNDIEIAQACDMRSIIEIVKSAGIDEKYLESQKHSIHFPTM